MPDYTVSAGCERARTPGVGESLEPPRVRTGVQQTRNPREIGRTFFLDLIAMWSVHGSYLTAMFSEQRCDR
jgi:hypothetical protein